MVVWDAERGGGVQIEKDRQRKREIQRERDCSTSSPKLIDPLLTGPSSIDRSVSSCLAVAYTEAHTALLQWSTDTQWRLLYNAAIHWSVLNISRCFGLKKGLKPWFDIQALICALLQIYWVNNLPHHMGVCTTRGGYYHCSVLTHSLLFVVFIWGVCVCSCAHAREHACPLSHRLKGTFLLQDLSTKKKSKQAKQEGRQTERERSVTEETDEWKMRGEKCGEKWNAGQASKDYRMKVV